MISQTIAFLGNARVRWCALALITMLFLFAHKLKVNRRNEIDLTRGEKGTAVFFFGRPLKLGSVEEVNISSSAKPTPLILRTNELSQIMTRLRVKVLFRGPYHVLVEAAPPRETLAH